MVDQTTTAVVEKPPTAFSIMSQALSSAPSVARKLTLLSIGVIAANIIADLMYALLDPRVRV